MKSSALSELARRTSEPPISWLMNLSLQRPEIISLAAGFTDNSSLPVTEARELLDEILRSDRAGRPALQYGTTAGDPALRELTTAHLRACDNASGDAYDAKRMVITNGSQQLLYMVTEALCDPGDIVLVEDPTYFVYLGITQSHGLKCRGVKMAEDGIDLADLERVLSNLADSGEIARVKMLYLVTYFQNPTGRTTSAAKKSAALKLLRSFEAKAGHPIYLLEDAAYRELRFAGDDVASALAGDGDRVIYTSTYSKAFASGARVGFGLLPQPLYDAVVRIKGNHDFGTSNLLQQLLSHALKNGAYARHLPTLRSRYAQKAAAMVKAVRAHFPADVEWQEPRGGLYIWARLPAQIHSGAKSRLFETALKREVLYVPGDLCYCEDPSRTRPGHEMRISFGGARDHDIPVGIQRLAEAIKEVEAGRRHAVAA